MKPLTTKQRSRSLLLLTILFILCAPIILLYSLGYRLDDQFTLQKTGGIFIHSDISNSTIFFDKEFLKNNGIFIRNALIQDLTPNKSYLVEFHKDGLQSWVKELYVYPSIVTEGRVLMLPTQFETREILQYVDSNNVATSTLISTSTAAASNYANPEFATVKNLFATTTKPIEPPVPATTTPISTTTIDEESVQKSDLEIFFETLEIKEYEKLPNFIVDGKEVSWLDAGNIQLHWIDDLSSIPYYYCGGLERECIRHIELDWGEEIKRFEYFPGRDDVWIVLVGSGIYAVEVDGRSQRNIQTIYEGKNLDFRLTPNDRIIIKEGSAFFEIVL